MNEHSMELTPLTKARMAEFADWLEASDRKVVMKNYFSAIRPSGVYPTRFPDLISCETAGCAAGDCVIMLLEKGKISSLISPGYKAREWLGLNSEQADQLFMPARYEEYVGSPQAMAEQKRKLLEVLRLQRPLNRYWLVNP